MQSISTVCLTGFCKELELQGVGETHPLRSTPCLANLSAIRGTKRASLSSGDRVPHTLAMLRLTEKKVRPNQIAR
jgi:hypothetical protein